MDNPLTPAAGSAIAFAWLIPVIPALSAGLLLLIGRRIGRISSAIAITAVGASATIATLVFVQLLAQGEEERTFVVNLGVWFRAGSFQVDWSLLVDPLASVMLLLVTWVGLLIHIYSLGYMAHDERYTRFFAYLNLFAASMLVLVLGGSFAVLFVGWELVGLCSYLLIGFWFARRDYAAAAKKAFITNRVGDVGFMIAMFVIYQAFGSLAFTDVLPAAGTVATGTLVAITLLLFVGATGKSAQIPLYVWLPDAMAGPTPVSALIHAATMVTAGVYLVARSSFLFALVPDVGLLVAWIGAATALVAAIIACAQTDLKRILAYSTVSQLGYMFIAVGVGSYTAGIFHLLTHGFFKALLFLAAGAVMHALHDHTDVRVMGGLWRKLPITGTTSLIGVAAIAGVPFLSGYFSKEEILAHAAETAGAEVLWVVALLTAGLTAFYMIRWFVLIFLGRPRWPEGVHPHEAPLSMTLPLVLLAIGAAAGGLINLPGSHWLEEWLHPSVLEFQPTSEAIPAVFHLPTALGIEAVGLLLGFLMYRRVDIATVGVGGGARLHARNLYYVDRIYEAVTVHAGGRLARGFARFDSGGIDGAVNGLGRAVAGLAGAGRRLQTGYVRNYALAVLAGTVLLGVLFVAAFAGGGS